VADGRRKVTLQDIADRCNLHKSTVSLILSGRTEGLRIRRETIQRVKKVAREMNYEPNRIARGLTTGRSNLIGYSFPYALPYSDLEYLPEQAPELVAVINPLFLGGMVARGVERGYEVVCLPRFDDPNSRQPMSTIFPSIIDGIVWIHPAVSNRQYLEILQDGRNLVLAGRCPENSEVPTCDIDNIEEAYGLARHLIDTGCRRTAYFCVAYPDFEVGLSRYEGFRRALGEAGIDPESAPMLAAHPDREQRYADLAALLASDPEVDSVFMASGSAQRILAMARDAGRDPEKDVHVGAFWQTGISEQPERCLTTVELDFFRMGYESADMLIDTLEDRKAKVSNRRVPCTLRPGRRSEETAAT
jgi:LacI family transcriptional regulator